MKAFTDQVSSNRPLANTGRWARITCEIGCKWVGTWGPDGHERFLWAVLVRGPDGTWCEACVPRPPPPPPTAAQLEEERLEREVAALMAELAELNR